MANIRVDLDYTIRDGLELKFRSPVDCSQITGLIVYYPGANETVLSKVFALADAHGSNVGDIDHLFAEDVVVKVILDVTKSMAFVQNADTNAYLEEQLASKAPIKHTHTAAEFNAAPASHVSDKNNPHGVTAAQVGARPSTWTPTASEVGAAPAGYGLGEIPHVASDVNTELSTGYFRTTSATANTSLNHGAAHVRKYNDSEVVQNILRVPTGVELVRYTTDGGETWIEEWVNPPMSEGTEYRTIERINGKAVYKKLTNGVIKYRLDGETTWKQYPIFEYGNSLPAAGTPGRIFFKKVSS